MTKKNAATADNKPPFKWRQFLKQVSRDLLEDISIREDLPDDVIAAGWLGYNGASEIEIVALENRLGKRLPPSYRTFLAETNGWRNCGPFIYKLWPCSDVRWFQDRNQDWIDAYVHPENNGIEIIYPNGRSRPEPRRLTDEEYLVYGEEQDSCRFRTEYLQSALEISDVGDSAILLLNPEIVTETGEWEAWLFANWMPGAHRYRSFRELMEGEHESFCRLRKELGPEKSKYGNAGQRAALRGETVEAVAILRNLADSGDDASAASLAELYAFLGHWDDVIACMGRVILKLGALPNQDGFPDNLLRLLGRAGHETGRWEDIEKLAAAAVAAERQRGYDKGPEQVSNAFVAWFENLQAYCGRRGRPPHELIRIFGNIDPVDRLTEAERRAKYEAAVAGEYTERLKSKPAEYACDRISLARNMKLDDEMIRIFEEFPTAIYLRDALDVARAYMRRENANAAWEVLRDRIPQSAGSPPEHVAPVILLVDDVLRQLMTRERCDLVLSTPRGREATPK
jgi:hypothetical protein